jgi:hypothetical protein
VDSVGSQLAWHRPLSGRHHRTWGSYVIEPAISATPPPAPRRPGRSRRPAGRSAAGAGRPAIAGFASCHRAFAPILGPARGCADEDPASAAFERAGRQRRYGSPATDDRPMSVRRRRQRGPLSGPVSGSRRRRSSDIRHPCGRKHCDCASPPTAAAAGPITRPAQCCTAMAPGRTSADFAQARGDTPR